MKAKASELKLGDTVKLRTGIWNSAIVRQIKDGMVTFWRPYGTTADFSYTSGVICYTGVEEFSVPQDSTVEYEVVERRELK